MPLQLTNQPPYYNNLQTIGKTITLTDAQIRVPGDKIILTQTPGKIYMFTGAAVTLNWVEDFTNVDATALIQIIAGSETRAMSSQLPGWIFENGASTTGFMSPLIELDGSQYIGQIHPTSDWINGYIALQIYNGAAGNMTAGNGNTLTINLFYQIIN